MSFDAPAKTNPANIRMNLIFPETTLAYIFAADSMGLSSFKFVQWAPKDASILRQSAGRKRILTSIATQGHSFCNQLPVDKGWHILLALYLKIPKK